MGACNVVGIFGGENQVRAQHRGFEILTLYVAGSLA